jgi:hypothetical protein
LGDWVKVNPTHHGIPGKRISPRNHVQSNRGIEFETIKTDLEDFIAVLGVFQDSSMIAYWLETRFHYIRYQS